MPLVRLYPRPSVRVVDRAGPIPNGWLEEDCLSDRNSQGRENDFRRPPTGPSIAPPRISVDRSPTPPPRSRGQFWTIAIFLLLVSGVCIRAYQDLSQPDAWDYWKDQYISPSMTFSLIDKVDLDGAGPGRRALLVSGTIGPAAANLFRDRLDQANLAAGDLILLSSPGGNLNQATIMGEIVRSRGLVTAVGSADASGRVPRQARLLRQRLRSRLCRRQDPVRCAGLGLGRSSICRNEAHRRSRRRNPADRRRCARLHDQDGRLVLHRGSDVRDQGHSLA